MLPRFLINNHDTGQCGHHNSMMRAVGPTAVSSLLALSLKIILVGGTAIYGVMCTIVILVLSFSTYLLHKKPCYLDLVVARVGIGH
jgi:hypothetical protein